jgi:FdrA protein
MPLRAFVKRNTYYDSITLMSIAAAIRSLPAIEDVGVIMATPVNYDLLRTADLFPANWLATLETPPGPEDVLIVVRAPDEQHATEALAYAEERLTTMTARDETPADTPALPLRSLEIAQRRHPEVNLAFISVSGEHAWLEAEQALHCGLHVFLFSDNVPIEHERRLKALAIEKDLLLMGPDCGTAVINGVGLGFSNVVPSGSIGIVGASGTGMQQLMCLLATAGQGISQAIGTGGRDLSEEIGGMMTLKGLALLAADEQTKVIVLVSKPPAERIAHAILSATHIAKPVVVIFLGTRAESFPTIPENVWLMRTLTEGAGQAVFLAGGDPLHVPGKHVLEQDTKRLAQERAKLAPSQCFIRALYAGGTLCDEAMLLLSEQVGAIASNIPLRPEWSLAAGEIYRGHTALDLGSDEFTRGRPHPMIDPSVRLDYFVRAARDPATAVILLDIVLGFGVPPDPATIYAAAIKQQRAYARQQGRYLPVIVSLCGTAGDPQHLSTQRAVLEAAGAIVYESNMVAALAAATLVQ